MEKVDFAHNQDRYENIFNMYKFSNENGDTYYFYNILSKLTLPADLDPAIFQYMRVEGDMPLTTLSYNIYKSQFLWWLILLTNNVDNPVKNIPAGVVIRVIKPEYLDVVFDSIKAKL